MANNVDNEHEPTIEQKLVRHRYTFANLPRTQLAKYQARYKDIKHNNPNTKHPFNQPTEGQGSRIQTKHSTPNIGALAWCSNINREHNHPREGETLCMEAPHTPHYRTGLSQAST